MKHDLRDRKILLIDGELFERKCQFLDELPSGFSPENLTKLAGPIVRNVTGDPIPDSFTVDGTCVIPIQGILCAGIPDFYKAYGFVDPFDVSYALDQVMADSMVKKILIYGNTPGGSVLGIPELSAQIARIQQEGEKPIGWFSDELSCSAGFYLACGATQVMGTPSSMWGNVGVYRTFTNIKKSLEIAGYKIEVFKSGEYKAVGANGDLTDLQRSYYQDQIDEVYADFKKTVQEFRPIEDADLQGQAFLGKTAVNKGFIDCTVANLEEAISLL
ncbi:MAG: signal peptide peptidase SppA, type [Verrucomicrobiales bacterium]|nr:signal peptide peptidase SppA, type [Verrucomicrobiales bacterium]